MYRTKPYIADAIIGNRKMLATITSNGQIQRLWWPRMDVYQQIEEWSFALTIDGHSNLLWLHDENEWDYVQNYLKNSPIAVTEGRHKTLPISWEIADFILPEQDCLIRQFRINNQSSKPMEIKLWQYSNFYINEKNRYNTVQYLKDIEVMLHYRANTVIGLHSSCKVSYFQCGEAVKEQIKHRFLNGNEHEMASSGGIMWDLGYVNGKDYVDNNIYLMADTGIDTLCENIKSIRNMVIKNLKEETIAYWNAIYKQSDVSSIKDENLRTLYLRSIMVFHLLSHVDLGGIIAAPEIDEDFVHCGGYGFCWGRDAAYITCAIDAAGYPEIVEKYYTWAASSQNVDGSWSQRHYLDGSIAPNWGLQIDETGSILWGIWEHYRITENDEFLSQMWPAIERGGHFLVTSIDKLTGLPIASYDLWEERLGQHTYSAAAVYGGLIGAAQAAKKLGFYDCSKEWKCQAYKIKDNIEKWYWDEETNNFLRGIKIVGKDGKVCRDATVDASLIGLVYPFGVLDSHDYRALSIAETIYDRLFSPGIGGIKRYEDDIYIGGNPWILTTLWLAYYYILIDELDRAKELFNWSIEHVTNMGLLPEQVHRNTGETAWVVPLTWSHAMFVLVIEKLLDEGMLD